jgi:hypothetical protein
MNEDLVRELVRRRLVEGRLPKNKTVGASDAPGDGRACDGCGEPMSRGQTTRWAVAVKDWMSIQLHADCFRILEEERYVLSRPESDGRSGQSLTHRL